jgi:hypothetical protein
MSNYEMQVGGNVENASIAMGDGAASGPVISGESARQRVKSLLNTFIVEVENCDPETPGATEVQTDAETVMREVISEKPDKRVIRNSLRRMEAWLDSVGAAIIRAGALTEALENIRSAIGHL